MKRAWTRGEKWLWAAPILFGIVALGIHFGPNAARRALGWPQQLEMATGTGIRSMTLAGNGAVLAAGGAIDGKGGWARGGGEVRLWDARTLQRISAFAPVYRKDRSGFTNGFDIYGLTFSPDGRRIGFSRAVEKSWGLYDTKSQAPVWRVAEFVADAQFSRDGKVLALSGDKDFFLVNASNGQIKSQWKRSGTANSRSISLSSDGALMACIGPYKQDDGVEIYRTRDGKLVRRLESKGAVSVAFSPDDKQLLVAAAVGSYSSLDVFKTFAPVRCYNVTTGQLKWEVLSGAFGGTDGLHSSFCDAIFSPDGHTIATYQYQNGQIFLLNAATGAIQKTLPLGGAARSNLFVPPALAFSPDGKLLFARGKSAILVWDLG